MDEAWFVTTKILNLERLPGLPTPDSRLWTNLLSSPPYEKAERNSHEWYTANWFPAPWKLFWRTAKLCKDAGGI